MRLLLTGDQYCRAAEPLAVRQPKSLWPRRVPMQDCVFCDILDGKADGSFAYRDSLCAVLADIRPANEGHLLVVPIEHSAQLDGLSAQVAGHLMGVAREVVAALALLKSSM